MCGLLTFISARGDAASRRDAIALALESLHHRGPDDTGVEVVGITAGASAPEVMVKDVIDTLRRMAPVELSTLPGEDEHIEFRVPLELLDVTGADKISKDGELGHTSHSETVGW